MRASYLTLGAVSVALGIALTQTSCFFTFDPNDCSQYLTPQCFASGTGAGGSDGGPPSCIPSMNSVPVADSCGVFVSSSKGSDTTGKGTKEAPYQTLTKALGAANGMPVYACGEMFTVTQSVSLSEKVDLYGALDCANGWAYSAANKTQLNADTTATPIPLTLASGATGSVVHDFAITAADATTAGSSSIAVLDDGADLTLSNVAVAARTGAPGTPGAAQVQVMTPATANGGNGGDDPGCNMMAIIPGGAGGTNTCPDGTATNGGAGGKGAPVSTGDNGLSGQPVMGSGNGGSGQTATASCNANDPKGADGSAGNAGKGAQGIGDVSASGYQPPSATLGTMGTDAQGGGGGGAALACDAPADMNSGPSGGGGGAGGCGGAPGNPGSSGGSSIGILALGASLTLTSVTITTSTGGAGGLGGNGQKGAAGGLGGQAGNVNACAGGAGGQGGAGGPGGGGAGGHSVGIAINGGTLPSLSSTTIMLGSVGLGGNGGDMDMTAQTKGGDGMACKTLDFGNPTSPTACAM